MSIDNSVALSLQISRSDLHECSAASRRVALGDRTVSDSELRMAAIINGRLDLLPAGEGYRKAFVVMGRTTCHAVIEQIFDHWEREMTLRPDDTACPIGDQRIITGTEA